MTYKVCRCVSEHIQKMFLFVDIDVDVYFISISILLFIFLHVQLLLGLSFQAFPRTNTKEDMSGQLRAPGPTSNAYKSSPIRIQQLIEIEILFMLSEVIIKTICQVTCSIIDLLISCNNQFYRNSLTSRIISNLLKGIIIWG